MADTALGLGNRNMPATPLNSGFGIGNVIVPLRTDQFGNQVVQLETGSKMGMVADEGRYFAAMNPTLGTGISGTATPTVFSDLTTLLFLRFGDGQLSKRLYLHYILLTVTAQGTSSTSFSYVMKTDSGSTRYTSGGTAITPVNPNADSTEQPGIDRLQFGAIVSAAAGAGVRTVDQGLVRSVIRQVGDRYLFTFGDSTPPAPSGVATDGTTQANITLACPQVILGPGQTFLLHEVAPAQTVAASYEIKMGFWIR